VINHEEEYDHKQKKIKNITLEFSEKTAKHECIDLLIIAVTRILKAAQRDCALSGEGASQTPLSHIFNQANRRFFDRLSSVVVSQCYRYVIEQICAQNHPKLAVVATAVFIANNLISHLCERPYAQNLAPTE
jgi:hypothetical protein